MHAELSVLPCSPTCANWLLYGVQPKDTKRGLVPGRCKGKVHQPETLGFTGRRVLVSRAWSGKTLADHRADNRDWIKTILAGHLTDTRPTPRPNPGGTSTNASDPTTPTYNHSHTGALVAISTRATWRKPSPMREHKTANRFRQHHNAHRSRTQPS